MLKGLRVKEVKQIVPNSSFLKIGGMGLRHWAEWLQAIPNTRYGIRKQYNERSILELTVIPQSMMKYLK